MPDDAIQKFVDATGGSVEQAIKYLSICDNNVVLAVECFVDEQPLGRDSSLQSNHSQSMPGCAMQTDDYVRAPIPTRTERIVEEHVRVGRFNKRPSNAFDGDRNFAANFSNGNPLAKRKLKGLAELFKPPSDITFIGTLEGAKRRGKTLQKWLLTNVQDVSDFKCQVLNRDLWCRQDVRHIIDQHFVFWQIYRDSIEGEHFMRFYNCATSPFIGIIDPGTGELMKQWDFLTKNEFISEVTLFLSDNYHSLHSPVTPPSKRPCTNRSRGALIDITDDEPPCSSAASASRSPTPPPTMSTETKEPRAPGITIVNGEIINNTESTSEPQKKQPRLDPNCLHVTFRLPDGSRRTHEFGWFSTCSELYSWLYSNGYHNHVILTHFPKQVVTSNTSLITSVVSCSRVMFHIEENDD